MSAFEEEQSSDDEGDSTDSSRPPSPDENLTKEQRRALAEERGGMMIFDMPVRRRSGSSSEESEEEEEAKEKEIEPMSFEESQKIRKMWTIPLPDSKQSPVGTCFLHIPLKPSLIHIDGPYLFKKHVDFLNSSCATFEHLLTAQAELDRFKKSRPQPRTYSEETQKLRKKLMKKWTIRHELMRNKDKWLESVRETSFDWEEELNYCGVPSPPVFFFDGDMNIRHISEYPHGLDQDPKKVYRTFRTSALRTCNKTLLSNPLGGLRKRNAASKTFFMEMNCCKPFKYLKYMSGDQVEKLRTMWYTQEQLAKLTKEMESITEDNPSEETKHGVERFRYYETVWRQQQEFFGGERLSFAYQRNGCRVAPIFFEDFWGTRYHYNDTKDGDPEDVGETVQNEPPATWPNIQKKQSTSSSVKIPLDRDDKSNFTKIDKRNNCLLTEFSSTFWWIFEAPLEPMATHYLYQETHELSIYIVLVKALDHLEKNPIPKDDIKAQKKYLIKIFRKMKCPCYFEIEQANRLSPYFSRSPEKMVKLARLCCVENHEEVPDESGRAPSQQPVPNQDENIVEVDPAGEPGVASGENSDEESGDDSGEESDDGSRDASGEESDDESRYGSGEESDVEAGDASGEDLGDESGDEPEDDVGRESGAESENYSGIPVNKDVPAPAQQQPSGTAPPRRLIDIMGDQYQVAPADQPVFRQHPSLVLPGSLPSTSYGVDLRPVQPNLSWADMAPAPQKFGFVNEAPTQHSLGYGNLNQAFPNLGIANMAFTQPNSGFVNLPPVQPFPRIANLPPVQQNLGFVGTAPPQPYFGLPNVAPPRPYLNPVRTGTVQSYPNLLCASAVQPYINPLGMQPIQPGQHGIVNYLDGEPINKWPRIAPQDVWNPFGGNL